MRSWTEAPAAQRLVSLSRPVEGLSPARFLRAARGQERFYWREAGRPEIFAGFGAAAELKAWGRDRFEEIERQARRLFAGACIREPENALSAPRLVGGFAFRDDFVPDEAWSAFHPAHFILPHFQLAWSEGESRLTINALAPASEEVSAVLASLEEALEMRHRWLLRAPEPAPQDGWRGIGSRPVQLRYPMRPEDWERMLEAALERIRAGEMKKVVLARMCEVRAGAAFELEPVLESLDEAYPGCYRFLFEPRPGHAFVGATPELLVETRGQELSTMALAGSIGRGSSPEEDAALRRELLESAKERHEHRLVVEAIRRRLDGWSAKKSIPRRPQILALSNIQHLYTPIRARLRRAEGVLPLAAHLHPTPALGGTPRARALAFIRAEEPVTRGWYAGPVGWIGPDLDGVFAVAIRSAVIQNERAWLYAGGGIVADSQPEKEWQETALKFRPMLRALGIESEVLSRA